jgi:hypothetical protein
MHFSMIECNFDVTKLSILVMYDVSYDAISYQSQIKWISTKISLGGTTKNHLTKIIGKLDPIFKIKFHLLIHYFILLV